MESVNPIPVGSEQAARVAVPSDPNPLAAMAPPGGSSAPTPGDQLAAATERVLVALDKIDGTPRRLLRKEDLRGKNTRRYMILEPPVGSEYPAVRFQALSGAEREEYEESFNVTDRKTGVERQVLKHMRVRLVRMTAVDENGALVFNAEDEGWLNEQDGAFIDWMFTASARFSKIAKRDTEAEVKN